MTQIYEAALQARRQVLGDAHVDRSMANVDPLAAQLQELVTEFAWGAVWTREELLRATRSLLTIAILTAGSHHDELRVHVRGALRNGCTPGDVAEVIMHSAVYCGMPAALSAMRVAVSALAKANSTRSPIGTLTIMAAGPENVFHAAKPVLDTLGDKVLLIGSRPGQGQLTTCANLGTVPMRYGSAPCFA